MSMSLLRRGLAAVVSVIVAVGVLTGCSNSSNQHTVVLVTHDSFAVSKNVLRDFERRSGLKVKILRGGDAGSAVNQAVLSKDHPQGDVFFGVDNTLLSRALTADIFSPYQAKGLRTVSPKFQLDANKHRVTPIDYGDVCVNYDRKYFADHQVDPPASLADLTKPEYKDLLVTEDPAASSPGLAFLLASVAQFGAGGWQQYWRQLKSNGVEIADSWDKAYDERFSGSAASHGKGDRPLVVSYGSSPPAEVPAGEHPSEAPTGVVPGTCFRQIEFAGLLKGAKHSANGKKLIDFLLTKEFQQDMPLQMYVYPVSQNAALPELFTKYAVVPNDSKTVDPQTIAKNRDQWLKTWRTTVLT